MMIKRIRSIKNVGTFYNMNANESEFSKVTVIYGENTYGKSTLCDILLSLANNDVELLRQRTTIPPCQNSSQEIKIQLSESHVEFKNGQWTQILKNLYVFGSDFIHKNLFTGLVIEHKNKENFTSFILGEDGNKLSKELEVTRKDIKERKASLKNYTPSYVKECKDSEIESFVKLDITNADINLIDTQIKDKEEILQSDKKLMQNATQILQRKCPGNFVIPNIDIIATLQNIQRVLVKTYNDIENNSKEKFLLHIQDHFNHQHQQEAETWIYKGIEYSKDVKKGHCVFCGQELKSAEALINVYQSYFNQEYKKFQLEIAKELDMNYKTILDTSFNKTNDVKNAIIILKDYDDLFNDADKNTLKRLEMLKESIENKERELNKIKSDILLQLNGLIEKKKQKYHESISDLIHYQTLENKLNAYLEDVKMVESSIANFIARIDTLKKPYQENTKAKEIEKLEKELKDLKLRQARVKQNDTCVEYVNCSKKIQDLIKEEKLLNDKITNEQSSYLEKYFNKINELFSSFGSRDFILKKQDGALNANKKVYSLSVEYKNQKIDNENLSKVFSESDKRALALAIFFAKIDLKSDEEKAGTIIVLDDPITSFDDGRMFDTLTHIKLCATKVSQIILLTHHSKCMIKCCEQWKDNEFFFYNLKKYNTGSVIEKCDKKQWSNSNMQNSFLKIQKFIDRDVDMSSGSDIARELRVYCEQYFKHFFIQDIEKRNLWNKTLAELITELRPSMNKIDKMRELVNPNHHGFIDTTDEDVRSFAQNMIQMLHVNIDNNAL